MVQQTLRRRLAQRRWNLVASIGFSFICAAQAIAQPASQPAASQPATSAPTSDKPATPSAPPKDAETPALPPAGELPPGLPPEIEPISVQPQSQSGGWSEDLGTGVLLIRRGNFSARMGGLIQIQAAMFVGKEAALQFNDPADNKGFRIRRARIGFSGELLPDVLWYLAIDLKDTIVAASGGDTGSEILDATITWAPYTFLSVSAGVDRLPFSSFALRSSRQLMLIERPLSVDLLAPKRRVGVRVAGRLGGLAYAAGVYNGSDGITSGNQLAGLAAGIRITYDLLGREEQLVPDEPTIQLAGGYFYDDGPATDSHRASVSLALSGYRVRMLTEFLWLNSKPDHAPTTPAQEGTVSRWGVAGQVGVFIWRERLELAARYEYFRDDDNLIELGRQQLFTGGANLYLCSHRLKLQVNYINRHEMSGPALNNNIAFAQLQASF
ncbi:MAG: hypothetical protein H6707_09140 [Deltaproteobacteria bacterium]|nr:hypothetical protein [Deltaproteobacteria bacterium]